MYYMIFFLFNPVWLKVIYIYIFHIRGYLQIMSCIEQGWGGNRKVMFDDKGGRGGLGKVIFCDKGEGGSRIPQICMTSLKDSPLCLKARKISLSKRANNYCPRRSCSLCILKPRSWTCLTSHLTQATNLVFVVR